ncbi:uncharacterized protein DUF3558 [Saccharothrix saharensis]|uniref:Uncharacterized protein DUF3558 n=2 Tax=Saccharothrix saharensis TaxID=571190 RepID=A0A543JBC2_9PSEU|nr:uncharacterized protein DUF3558 [Saccharothrix saharensis]
MLAMLALVSACSPSVGTPTPETTTTAAAETSSPSAEPSSARPREVRLDGVQPCTLLTAEQLPALKIDRQGRPVTSDFYKTTACSWSVTGAGNRLVPVTKEGIEAWTGGERTGRPTDIEPIFGFPAITVTVPSDPAACDVMVDTADGQYLVAAFSVDQGFEDRFPEPCDGARQLAKAAMQNLVK